MFHPALNRPSLIPEVQGHAKLVAAMDIDRLRGRVFVGVDMHWLVVFSTPLKNRKVNWDD